MACNNRRDLGIFLLHFAGCVGHTSPINVRPDGSLIEDAEKRLNDVSKAIDLLIDIFENIQLPEE